MILQALTEKKHKSHKVKNTIGCHATTSRSSCQLLQPHRNQALRLPTPFHGFSATPQMPLGPTARNAHAARSELEYRGLGCRGELTRLTSEYFTCSGVDFWCFVCLCIITLTSCTRQAGPGGTLRTENRTRTSALGTRIRRLLEVLLAPEHRVHRAELVLEGDRVLHSDPRRAERVTASIPDVQMATSSSFATRLPSLGRFS